MTRLQIGSVLGAFLLFMALYFMFSTKKPEGMPAEIAATLGSVSGNLNETIADAKEHLDMPSKDKLGALEKQLSTASNKTDSIALMKQISGWWFPKDKPSAGAWAEKVAALENSDAAWSVTGATFYEALLTASDQGLRNELAEHAVKAFQTAATLNPEKVEHQVNVALVYAENPSENPMKAVLTLRDLEQKHPDNASVYNALGRLAIKTGQWERAVQRLEKAMTLDPGNPNTPCLLAKAYEGLGNMDKAQEYSLKCK